MIIQINPRLVASDDNHFQQSSRPNKHKSYQELTLKTGTHSVSKYNKKRCLLEIGHLLQ